MGGGDKDDCEGEKFFEDVLKREFHWERKALSSPLSLAAEFRSGK